MRVLLLFVSAIVTLSAQTAFVTGAGYSLPPAFAVAPGQVVTFYVGGLPQTAPDLQQVSAVLTVGSLSQTVSILSAKPTDASTIAFTVLIPFSLAPGSVSAAIQFTGSDGTVTEPVNLNVVGALPHIITTCDTLYGTATSPCQLAVTHQDGSLVTNSAPAKGGEILSIWAVGLGVPASGIPAEGSGPIAMNDILLNSGFTITYAGATSIMEATTPYLFAGLSSVTGGLYQINFAVPQPPSGLQACTQSSEWFIGGGNLQLSIFRPVVLNQSTSTVTTGTFGALIWSAAASSQVSSICVTP